MVEKTETEDVISFEEIVVSDMLTLEALITVLDKKGIISKQELSAERAALQMDMLQMSKQE